MWSALRQWLCIMHYSVRAGSKALPHARTAHLFLVPEQPLVPSKQEPSRQEYSEGYQHEGGMCEQHPCWCFDLHAVMSNIAVSQA